MERINNVQEVTITPGKAIWRVYYLTGNALKGETIEGVIQADHFIMDASPSASKDTTIEIPYYNKRPAEGGIRIGETIRRGKTYFFKTSSEGYPSILKVRSARGEIWVLITQRRLLKIPTVRDLRKMDEMPY